jgi:hypothetical protein
VKEESITVEKATLTKRADGIFHINYAENETYTIKENREILKRSLEFRGNAQAPILITGGTFTSHDAESREFNSSEEVMKHCKAVAIVSKSLAGKMIANFFINFNKPGSPTRFFSNQKDAIKWLLKFK